MDLKKPAQKADGLTMSRFTLRYNRTIALCMLGIMTEVDGVALQAVPPYSIFLGPGSTYFVIWQMAIVNGFSSMQPRD